MISWKQYVFQIQKQRTRFNFFPLLVWGVYVAFYTGTLRFPRTRKSGHFIASLWLFCRRRECTRSTGIWKRRPFAPATTKLFNPRAIKCTSEWSTSIRLENWREQKRGRIISPWHLLPHRHVSRFFCTVRGSGPDENIKLWMSKNDSIDCSQLIDWLHWLHWRKKDEKISRSLL